MKLEKLFVLAVGAIGGYCLFKQNIKLAYENEELRSELNKAAECADSLLTHAKNLEKNK